MYNQPIEEVDFAAMAARLDQPVGLLTAGRPCEPYSKIRTLNRGGQEKRDKSLPPEAHELGHLDYFMLSAIDHLNPHTVIIENVPGYLEAGSGFQTIGVLKAFGYNVEARVLNALDYGSLQARKRAVIVATTHDEIRWPETVTEKLMACSILEEIPDGDDGWFGLEHWAPKHWAKQSAKGNGFAAPSIDAMSTSVPTLKKRYYAGQGDNFVVAHPRLKDTWRWLTLTEGRRLMGVPDTYDLGTTKTIAGEVLGQGVDVTMFKKVIASVTGR
jgi:site-specific DNA-cytosine methylase